MFDETKDVWIKIYKVITIILFFILIAIGIAELIIISITGGNILIGAAYLIVGIIGAFIALASCMFTLNLLKNVQIIRSTLVKSTLWRCECGAVNNGPFCKKCGNLKP